MNNSILNDWMTLTANVAVVAGIVFLGLELQQNNELLRTQANLVLSQNRVRANEVLATDERLAGLLTSEAPLSERSPVDRYLLERWYAVIFTRWEWEHRQYVAGLIDEAYFPVSGWIDTMNVNPGMKEFWTEEKHRGRSAVFVEFMDQRLASQEQ